MFGYVVVDKPNMLIKDFADYRAYYCGLCKTLGKEYNNLTRFSVNYDITFLTLLLHNYEKLEPKYEQSRCIAHPIGAKKPMVLTNPIQEIVAHINIIMAYYKVKDDIIDEGKIKHKLLMNYIRPLHKKAKRKIPSLDEASNHFYNKLRAIEESGEGTLDSLADCFANILVQAGRSGTKNFDDNLALLCYNLGRWIYIIDALDDLQDDFEAGKFNPLIGKQVKTLDKELKDKIVKETEILLNMAIAKIRIAYDKMEIKISEGALSNIIYIGLKSRVNSVISKFKGEDNGSV